MNGEKNNGIIALTGGIASGKSTVSRRLKKLGATVVDADATTARLQEPGAPVWRAYVAHFGERILLENGALNRPMIANIIYGDERERMAVNAMAHPLVKGAMYEEAAAASDCPAIIFDVPLLFEIGWEKEFAAIWLVYVPPEKQLVRLMRRNNIADEEEARRIITAQMPLDEKRARADIVIDNGGNLRRTYAQVDAAWATLIEG